MSLTLLFSDSLLNWMLEGSKLAHHKNISHIYIMTLMWNTTVLLPPSSFPVAVLPLIWYKLRTWAFLKTAKRGVTIQIYNNLLHKADLTTFSWTKHLDKECYWWDSIPVKQTISRDWLWSLYNTDVPHQHFGLVRYFASGAQRDQLCRQF